MASTHQPDESPLDALTQWRNLRFGSIDALLAQKESEKTLRRRRLLQKNSKPYYHDSEGSAGFEWQQVRPERGSFLVDRLLRTIATVKDLQRRRIVKFEGDAGSSGD